MKKIYEKTVKELIREFVNSFELSEKQNPFGFKKELSDGGEITRNEILHWFKENFPKIKKGTINAHLILLSVNAPSRIHYNVHSTGEDDLLYQVGQSSFKLFQKEEGYNPIYKIDNNIDESENDSIEQDLNEFAYEKDLQNFLSKNLDCIESGLTLFEDGDINGIEYPVGGRFIDILALDKNNDFVVIELKVSKGYDRVIGQLLRYMAWIEQNQAEKKQKVRGMIICKEISYDLRLACSKIRDVSLFEYDLSIKIRAIENATLKWKN